MSEVNGNKGVLRTPYPELLVRPFAVVGKFVFKNVTIPRLSDRMLRRVLIIMAIASVPFIWFFEGITNPLEVLVDIPFFAYNELPSDYQHYYLIFLPFFTMIAMKILNTLVCGRREFPVFSFNGVLCWITSLAMGIMADVFTRNIFLEKFYVPLFNRLRQAYDIREREFFVFLLLFTMIALYFSLEDMITTTASMIITPFLLPLIDIYGSQFVILQNRLVSYLIITAVLKLVLIFLEKTGVLADFTNMFIKYLCTPLYMPIGYGSLFLIFIILPVLPFLLIIYMFKVIKRMITKKGVK